MKKLLVLSILILLISCAPSAEMIQTAIAETTTAESIIQETQYAEAEEKVAIQNTQIAQTKTAAVTNTPKFTPTPRNTATPTNTPLPPKLITATAFQKTQQYIASFGSIAWKELKGYPDNHSGEKIKIKGKVFQIIDGIDMLLWYPGTYDAFYVSFDDSYTGIYEDDTITIYGEVISSYCYDTQAGGTNCVPLIQGFWYQK